eukprot:m.360104 g.360104  ORF g.360104 m.360104 type:complete len:566 (-) comp18891_c0_seq1:427-2124(-)
MEGKTIEQQLEAACEYIPNRLYFATVSHVPKTLPTNNHVYICIDELLVYQSFCADFGPLNLAMTYHFCEMMNDIITHDQFKSSVLYLCTTFNQQKRSNAAVLIGAYAIVYLGMTAQEAYRPLRNISPPLLPFRDAAYCRVTYRLTVESVLAGFHQALVHKFFDFTTFDVSAYERYERVEYGDFNWIIPGKFLAFAGPHNVRHVDNGYPHFAPEDYFEYFRENGVTGVVRFNRKLYDRMKFVRAGFEHHDLFFVDGSTPPDTILTKFLEACEAAKGALAVHCKAGIGRTGTLIGCYMMKHYRMTAHEVIAWLRIARPGCVIGPQQQYLIDREAEMWKAGSEQGNVQRLDDRQRPAWCSTPVVDFIPRGRSDAQASKPSPLSLSASDSSKPLDVTPSKQMTPLTSTAGSQSQLTSLPSTKGAHPPPVRNLSSMMEAASIEAKAAAEAEAHVHVQAHAHQAALFTSMDAARDYDEEDVAEDDYAVDAAKENATQGDELNAAKLRFHHECDGPIAPDAALLATPPQSRKVKSTTLASGSASGAMTQQAQDCATQSAANSTARVALHLEV